jgi:hypothetical protein
MSQSWNDIDWEEFDDKQVKEKIKELSNDPSILKPTRPKDIDVVPNKIVKTNITVEQINPGINLIKGYDVKCPQCGNTKTIYNPWIKTCKAAFENKKEQEGKEPCITIGARGGVSQVQLKMTPKNDTGYFTQARDPNEKGSNPIMIQCFFSNKVMPKNKEEREKFEIELQRENTEVTGIIKTRQSREKGETDWYIDVTSYKIVKKNFDVDMKLLRKYKEISKDKDFFAKYVAPDITDKYFEKRRYVLAVCSPHEIILPNKEKIYTNQRITIIGDQGEAKTTIGKKIFMLYTEDTNNSSFLYAENSTTRGLIVKNVQRAGKWQANLGEIPKRNKGGVILDGWSKLNQEDNMQLRSISEECKVESNKAGGHISAEACVHLIKLGNLKNPVHFYPTKHDASFDVSATTLDVSRRFEGADRRREDCILVVSQYDTNPDDIAKNLYLNDKTVENFDEAKYWKNKCGFAWSRKPEDIILGKEIIEYAIEKVSKLRNKYPGFGLEYGILGKGGEKIFIKTLPAVSILFGDVISDNGKVGVTEKHCDWLFNVFDEELTDLGLGQQIEQIEFYNAHAIKIIENADVIQLDILKKLFMHRSQSEIERKKLGYTRKTMYNHLKDVLKYEMDYEDGKQDCYYSFIEGSGEGYEQGFQENSYYVIGKPDDLLPPLSKRDGSFTQFGQILLRLAGAKVKSNIPKLKKGEK